MGRSPHVTGVPRLCFRVFTERLDGFQFRLYSEFWARMNVTANDYMSTGKRLDFCFDENRRYELVSVWPRFVEDKKRLDGMSIKPWPRNAAEVESCFKYAERFTESDWMDFLVFVGDAVDHVIKFARISDPTLKYELFFTKTGAAKRKDNFKFMLHGKDDQR